MADTKISALTALAGASVDTAADVLPIVDTSAATTKKITAGDLAALGLPADYIAALGKVTASGNAGHPTLFDPTGTAWDDGAWMQTDWVNQSWYWGYETFTTLGLTVRDTGTARFVDLNGAANSDGFAKYLEWYFHAQLDNDGATGSGYVGLDATGGGHAFLTASLTAMAVDIKGQVGQTDPLLDLQASDATSVVKATGDKKVGFYNKAPVALQTGVAVSAAGIHAALVNLGLITA